MATTAPPTALPPAPAPPLTLNRERNLKYWLRCVRTLLPTEYTTTDTTRTTLAFFCLAALDLLGSLGTSIKEDERTSWIDWIYHCQLPSGGFRGSPATDFGELRNSENECYDVATVPSTYFALASLITLGDDLSRVNRQGTLNWLKKMQRDDDGSFAEYEGAEKRDLRFVYCASAVRYILRGNTKSWEKLVSEDNDEKVEDIDIDKAVAYIHSTEAYDCGFAAAPSLESHAGYGYCATASLSLLGRLSELRNPEAFLHYLVSRQRELSEFTPPPPTTSSTDDPTPPQQPNDEDTCTSSSSSFAGFNGRNNKPTDTCYSFWVAGALDILKKSHLIDVQSNRDFLLNKTAHLIGGFGKLPGSLPDILHSSLAVACLSIYREEGLNRIDSALCMSLQAKERLEGFGWWKGE